MKWRIPIFDSRLLQLRDEGVMKNRVLALPKGGIRINGLWVGQFRNEIDATVRTFRKARPVFRLTNWAIHGWSLLRGNGRRKLLRWRALQNFVDNLSRAGLLGWKNKQMRTGVPHITPNMEVIFV